MGIVFQQLQHNCHVQRQACAVQMKRAGLRNVLVNVIVSQMLSEIEIAEWLQ